MVTASLELFDGTFWQDPYPAYAALRSADPVCRIERPGGPFWLISRYADVRAAFTDPRLSKDWRYTLPEAERAAQPATSIPMLLLMDPPEHTRLRKLVSRTFTLRRMEALRPRVRAIADELIDALPESGPAELMANFAFLLPVFVICELLGVPADRRDDFAGWSNTMIDAGGGPDAIAATGKLQAFLVELVDAKRTAPDDALISGLIEVAEDGDQLSQDELVAMAMILLIAGHETTVNLIGNGLLALYTQPGQRATLIEKPELIGPAVEEFLRWDSPVHTTPVRFAAEDVEYAGVTIPAGSQVLLSLAAANRDDARFDDPDELRIDRDAGTHSSGHIAFGHGLHHCLGAQLARIEGQEAIGRILARRPATELAVDPAELVYRESILVRGVRELPVTLGPEA